MDGIWLDHEKCSLCVVGGGHPGNSYYTIFRLQHRTNHSFGKIPLKVTLTPRGLVWCPNKAIMAALDRVDEERDVVLYVCYACRLWPFFESFMPWHLLVY